MVDRWWYRQRRCGVLIAGLMVGVSLPLSAHAQTSVATVESERTTPSTSRVTLSVTNMALPAVLRLIAEQAGLRAAYDWSIIPSNTRVSLRAQAMPVTEAYAQVLRGTGLVAQVRATGNVAIVRDATADDEIVVTGTVLDKATKQPVAGATVTVEGANLTVRTDARGTFRIVGVPVGPRTITARRLGYAVGRQSIRIADEKTLKIDFALDASVTALQQVVTTITGPQRRLEVGNAISVINADSLMREAPITTISQLLTARAPGLMVLQGQGTVGGDVNLQIRGKTSIGLTTDPIVILDGIRISSRPATSGQGALTGNNNREPVSPLNDLNPNDIETVEVVKGPSAATLYGTDASNGVIVITTKRGKAGPPRWTAFMRGMMDEVPGSTDFQPSYSAWANDGTYDSCRLLEVAQDWCHQDSVTHTKSTLLTDRASMLHPARSWEYGAGVSGGQSTLRYFFSGNFTDLTGPATLPDTLVTLLRMQRGVKKLPDELIHPNVQSNLNLRSNVAASLGPMLDVNLSSGYVHGSTRSIDANFRPYEAAATGERAQDVLNTIRDFFSRTSTEANDRIIASVQGQARPFGWLTARALTGIDLATRDRHELLPRDATNGVNPLGSVYEGRTRQRALSADGGFTGTVRRGSVSARTSVGAQYVRTLNDVLNGLGTNLPPGARSITQALTRSANQQYSEAITFGTFVEEVLGINERLFLTGALRSDGASAFGTKYTRAVYPKASLSWLVSQEPFIPQVPGLDEVRFRAALGTAGRQALPYMMLPQYRVVPDGELPSSAGYGRPVALSSLGNPELRPERGREFEAGSDIGLFDRRLQLGLTWYARRTSDLITGSFGPAGINFLRENLGLTTERGFESQINATVLDTRPLSWSLTLQSSSNRTKLVDIGSATPSKNIGGGYVEGYPLGARFIVPFLGYDDANQNGIVEREEVQLGDSAVYAGNNTPSRSQTLSTTVGLLQHRFRISALFDRQVGVSLINQYSAFCDRCRAAMDPTTPLAQQASYIASSIFTPNLPGYRYIETGNFTRLREVSAALSLPVRVTRSLHVASGSVSLSARNLALWSKFSGPDPESVPISTNLSRNAALGMPQSRSWTFRCDLGL